MNTKRKGLLLKILLFIGLPVAITYCVVAAISLYTVNQSVTTLTASDLSSKSQAASNEIGGIFSGYQEIVEQMAANTQFQALFLNTTPGIDIATVPGYGETVKTLINVQKTNPDNILAAKGSEAPKILLSKDDYDKY